MILLELKNNTTRLGNLPPELRKELSDLLSYEVEGAGFASRARGLPPGVWDGRKRLMKRDNSFPAGLTPLVIKWAKESNLEIEYKDYRVKPVSTESFEMSKDIRPRPYQSEALELSRERVRGVYVLGTGCLSGDAEILINRKSGAVRYTLTQAFKSWTSTNSRGFDRDHPIYTRSFVGDKIKLNIVHDIVQSGVKELFKLTLENGLTIKATACHKFLTRNRFARLDQLTLKHEVMCDINDKSPNKKRKKPVKSNYLQLRLRNHPFCGGSTKNMDWKLVDGTEKRRRVRTYRVPLHRVIVESHLSGLEPEEFILRVKSNQLDGLVFLDPKEYAVHHMDHDTKNNSIENLQHMTHAEHAKEHGDFDRFGLGVASFSKVKSIEPVGKEMTYDMVCGSPWRNFVANRMVVHNSGKTLTSAMIVNDKKMPTLFITPDVGLREQTMTVYRKLFDEKYLSTEIRSGRPIIITNIHQIKKYSIEDLKRFHVLVIDEFHHSGSDQYLELNHLMPDCYHRYGLTGTYVRGDGKDMVMQGVLSNILMKRTTSQVIRDGFLVPPDIIVTDYVLKKKSSLNYRDAYAFMTTDLDFNKMVSDIIRGEIFDEKQTLVLVRRIEHGELLRNLVGNDAVFLSGKTPYEYREEVKRAFMQKKIRCMIATDIFGEGQDIPSIDSLINVRLQESEIQTKQGVGRALRLAEGSKSYADSVKLGKAKARIFDFKISGNKHLSRHSLARIEHYRSEDAFIFI